MNRPEAIKEAFSKVDKVDSSSKLVDMKCSPSKKEGLTTAQPEPAKQPSYPYGLRLSFDQDEVTKLPKLKTFKVGDQVAIAGKGEVIELRMREEQGGKESWSVEIQIKKINVTKGA